MYKGQREMESGQSRQVKSTESKGTLETELMFSSTDEIMNPQPRVSTQAELSLQLKQ